jgi:hypothetical protein
VTHEVALQVGKRFGSLQQTDADENMRTQQRSIKRTRISESGMLGSSLIVLISRK